MWRMHPHLRLQVLHPVITHVLVADDAGLSNEMSVPEGVHWLTNAHTKGILGLGAEWWYFCCLKDCQSSHDDSPAEQWLIARPPGASDDVRVMVNLRTGGYAGVWKDAWGRFNDHVNCTPSHLTAANIQWTVLQLPDDETRYTFRWSGESVKVLTCDGPAKKVKAKKPRSEDRILSMHWYPDHVKSVDSLWPDWMDRLPNDIMLTDINMPCTHQTLASHGIAKIRPDLGWGYLGDRAVRPWIRLPRYVDNPRCQDLSLWDQLQLGIRGFDIRLDLDRLPVLERKTDGSVGEGHKYFLYARHANSSEFLLMNVRYERSAQHARDRRSKWLQTFVDETEMFWKEDDTFIYKWWEKGQPNMNDLSLSSVSGKVIFTEGVHYMPADGKDGRRPNMRFLPRGMRTAGKYNSPRDQWEGHLQACEDNINTSKLDRRRPPTVDDFQRYYQTSFNVSGLPNFLGLKFFLANPFCPSAASRDSANEVFDPVDFFQYFKDKWTARGDDHPLSEKNLGKNGKYRIGKVDFDFCDQIRPWIVNIIHSNRTKPGREF
nr:hypothetical protein CFP56_09480 [Quercus suber]